ncbi:Hydroxyacylglutathione hydrolase (Glyoxalase II) (Glx II) [Durusdinium trenchii]|uniref:Hydroxyacylglutathione hydrolase (Glyoxalase II) (Glx II) n=1 Tax=Durusdinium trenchii TaxID=1381693 RepID=A0ABP0I6Q6_9DINO
MVLVESASSARTQVHQLLCGREIANDKQNPVHRFAMQMANFVYVVVHEDAQGNKKGAVIDPAWDVDGVYDFVEQQLNAQVQGCLYTHRHFDHCGGKVPRALTGLPEDLILPGLADFVERGVDVYVGAEDARQVAKQSHVALESITSVDEGHVLELGAECKLHTLATPGHTPGSVSFLLQPTGVLFTGDTLFIGSCGRVDLPESNGNDMLQSLARLSALKPDTVVLPGHNYSMTVTSTIEAEKETNMMMIQAIGRFQRSGLSSEPVAAMLPLPDYLGVVRKLLAHDHEEQQPPPELPPANQLESHV